MRYVPILLFAILACGCRHAATDEQETQTSVQVKCVAPARSSVDVMTVLEGRIAAPPGGDLPVASQVPGRIETVSVREGDHLTAGALVATIDGSTSRDALQQAEANVAEATAGQENANATLERTKQLVARGIAAKQELDDARAKAEQAHAALASANAASDFARRTLGRVQVKSTFEGVVTRIWRGPGALVDGTASTPIVQLSATALAEVDADATERQLDMLRAGQTATVQLVTQTDPLQATIRTRATALDST
ncbi:MAG: efflux RND transporter periplasmic adaptor subunit, partial [Polyangiaceae bacterium]